jgi:CBS domain-containing protein
MKVKDVMHKGAEWVAPQTALADVAKKMRDLDIGAISVGENDRLIGMVTDRDIACRGVANGGDCARLTARVMAVNGCTCPTNFAAEACLLRAVWGEVPQHTRGHCTATPAPWRAIRRHPSQ